MAGAGEFSRIGNHRALNSNLMSEGATGAIGGCDIIGTITTGILTNTSTTSIVLSGGITKAIPDKAIVISIPAAGTIGSVQAWCVNGAVASGGTTVTVQAQTTRTTNGAIVNGDKLALLSFLPFLALATTAPTDTALGTEYTNAAYARQAILFTAPTAADPPVAAINGQLTYGPMSGTTTGTIGYSELMDALTGGTASNMYAWWTEAATVTPAVGDSVTVATATGLTMSCFH